LACVRDATDHTEAAVSRGSCSNHRLILFAFLIVIAGLFRALKEFLVGEFAEGLFVRAISSPAGVRVVSVTR